MKMLAAVPLLAAVLLGAGGVPTAAAQEPVAPVPVVKTGPGTEHPDGHTSRGCSFLFLRWC